MHKKTPMIYCFLLDKRIEREDYIMILCMFLYSEALLRFVLVVCV